MYSSRFKAGTGIWFGDGYTGAAEVTGGAFSIESSLVTSEVVDVF